MNEIKDCFVMLMFVDYDDDYEGDFFICRVIIYIL